MSEVRAMKDELLIKARDLRDALAEATAAVHRLINLQDFHFVHTKRWQLWLREIR